ncbi:hypothetical protein [Paenibacillus humicus]|uniref:hypothetical protein n=1 Tax=Paenibacillus humicus TaxID=412861 RepID=UPI003D2E68D8
MQNTKVLPVSSPLLNGYSHYGSIFSILGTLGDSYFPWLFSRFAQLVADPVNENAGLYINIDEPEWFPRTTNFCPFIDTNIISKKMFDLRNKIVDSIIDALQQDYYVFMVVEQYYIPDTDAYKKFSHNHDIMIYGFDRDKKTLYIADNFNGKYQFSECYFSQFVDAYYHTNEEKDRLNSNILLFKKKKLHTEFDQLRLIDNLNSYLTGIYPEMRSSHWHQHFQGWAKGLDIYLNVKEYLYLLKSSRAKFDKRTFYAIWEHKKLMVMRIEYMHNNNYITNANIILERYQHIERLTLKHQNMIIKFGLTGNSSLIETVIREIDEVSEMEKQLIPNILKNLHTPELDQNTKILGLQMNHKLKWNLT